MAGRLRTAGCAAQTVGEDWLKVGDFGLNLPETGSLDGDPPAAAMEQVTEKVVDLEYPRDNQTLSALAKSGYEVAWCAESDVARRVDIEGWTVATIREGGSRFRFRMRDRPQDQILVLRGSSGKLTSLSSLCNFMKCI